MKTSRTLFQLALMASLLWAVPASAVLDLELTQGIESPLPIAIIPFAGEGGEQPLTSVISHDLNTSGRFKLLPKTAFPQQPQSPGMITPELWKSSGVETMLIGSAQPLGNNRYRVSFTLMDLYNGKQTLISGNYTVSSAQFRRLGHKISDSIYEKLTGIPGIFSSRIAYVLVRGAGPQKQYQLVVADADGFGARPLLTSHEPIMSPAWSHDGKQLAYVSFENKRSQIYISNIASGDRKLVTQYPGINSAPAWSRDDQHMAVVLSKSGAPKIYTIDLRSNALKQVTFNNAIDTEPTWSTDGRSLIFTSDRGGAPQLYRINLDNGQTDRLTFSGGYNARASLSPDGKTLAMIHAENGGYHIGVQPLAGGNLRSLTQSGREDSPSIAPNGNMVLYGTEYGELGVVSIDGRVNLRLPASEGIVQDPAWGPKA